MKNEKIEDLIKKIPVALKNINVPEDFRPLLKNYIHNLILTSLKDKETILEILANEEELERLSRL